MEDNDLSLTDPPPEDFGVGNGLQFRDEVITCGLSKLAPDSHGQHRHDDSCFEVRTIRGQIPEIGRICVTDALDFPRGAQDVCACVCTPAPSPLLRRKTEAFKRLAQLFRGWESRDQSSARDLLDRAVKQVDNYLFAGQLATQQTGSPDVGPRASRTALDAAVPFILSYRRDAGRGQVAPHLLVRQTIHALNTALPADEQIASLF